MKKFAYVLFIMMIVFITACQSGNTDQEKSDENLVIYTSIYPLEFIVKQIADNHASVKSIYPPGVDAHTYEPTSKELTDIARGDAFFYIGAGMESFSENIADSLADHDIVFVEIGNDESLFIEDTGHEHDDHDHYHGDFDPHIWLDPLRMIDIGERLLSELTKLVPENKETFQSNFAALKEDLLALDEEFSTTLESKSMKKVIVSHAAYGYWEERYGLEQIAISGLSSSDEPSQKELADIVRYAEDEQMEYVIFDQTGSNRLAEIIRENIGAEKLLIHNLEVLTEEDVENEADYVSLMRQNLQTLDKATKE